ncbi:MAG: HPr family phosphocarrier protein [Anaerolineaceae bacterium]
MVINQISLKNGSGLHARPASDFVREASKFTSEVLIRNINSSTDWVDAKSILSILTLGIENHHKIEIKAAGPDEKEALKSLTDLVENNFNLKA